MYSDILEAVAAVQPIAASLRLDRANVIVVESAFFDIGRLAPVLNGGERKRFDAFRNDSAAADFAVAHALKRIVLAERLGVESPATLRFGIGQWGKPFLLDYRQPFNLSHSNGYVAFVFSLPGISACGIDIEAHTQRNGLEAIIASTMTQPERAAIAGAACGQTEFYKRWTIKEAFVKSSGLGLHYPLASLCTVDDMEVGEGTSHLHGVAMDWISTPKFSLAVGAVGEPRRLRQTHARRGRSPAVSGMLKTPTSIDVSGLRLTHCDAD